MLSPALGQTGELAYQITARLTLPQGRGTGTREEADAARWLAELLHSWGLKVQQEEFLAIADMNWFPMSAAGLCLLSYLLFPWPGWSSWVAGALALWPPLLLWWALTRADSPLRALLPRVESRSIITCLPPQGSPPPGWPCWPTWTPTVAAGIGGQERSGPCSGGAGFP